VAVDAMGGDHAPHEVVAGSLQAARGDPSIHVVLVGRPGDVEDVVQTQGGAPDNISILHATELITMGESPVDALKKKPDASILRAVRLVAEGEADAVIAAGSTGATVAAAMMTLKRLPGVRRPGIAVPMPARNKHGVCLLLDGGANPICRPHHLYQYGVMGANYYKEIFDESDPRVALVSIGQEESKGIELTREAAQLLRESPVNFAGNVEDIFAGDCEVGVADGFVGNIILKSAEGFAEMLLGMVNEVLAKESPAVLGSVAHRVDYAEFGGAPLLGFDGIVMICHGRSEQRAISNAIRSGVRAVQQNVNRNIVEGLTRLRTGSEL
jgi:glycerol-3-phosphate acyltransferase PlsX